MIVWIEVELVGRVSINGTTVFIICYLKKKKKELKAIKETSYRKFLYVKINVFIFNS